MLPATVAAALVPAEGVVHPGLSQRAHDWVMARASKGHAAAGLARAARKRWPKVDGAAPYAPFGARDLAESAQSYADDLARLAAWPRVTLLHPQTQA
jgi:hypothetical protein